MRKMRNFSRVLSAFLAVVIIATGFVLPQTLVATGDTGSSASDDGILTQTELFGSGDTISVAAGGTYVTSSTAVAYADYVLSYDVRMNVVDPASTKIVESVVCLGLNATGTVAGHTREFVSSGAWGAFGLKHYITPASSATRQEDGAGTITHTTTQEGDTENYYTQWFSYDVYVYGNTAEIYVDNILVATFSQLPAVSGAYGYIGFRTGRGCEVKNVQVTDLTVEEGQAYPANLFYSDAVFNKYFDDAQNFCSFSEVDGEYVLTYSTSNANHYYGGGYYALSKAPISTESYIISFDTKAGSSSKSNPLAFVIADAGATPKENMVGYKMHKVSDTAYHMAYKTRVASADGQTLGATSLAMPSQWAHVEILVCGDYLTVSYTYDSTNGSNTFQYSTKFTDASVLTNYVGFTAEYGTSEYLIKNYAIEKIADPEAGAYGTVYPTNLFSSKYVFEKYFTDANNLCTFTKENGEDVMTITSTTYTQTVVSKTPVSTEDYVIAFDMQYDYTNHGQYFVFQADATGKGADTLGISFHALSASSMREQVIHKINNADPTKTTKHDWISTTHADDWIRVTIKVEADKAIFSYSYINTGNARKTYYTEILFSDYGYENGLENYFSFVSRQAGVCKVKNFQIYYETGKSAVYPEGVCTDLTLAGQYILNQSNYNTVGANGTTVNATFSGRVPATTNRYEVAFDAKISDDVAIYFNHAPTNENGQVSEYVMFRIACDANGTMNAYTNGSGLSQTYLGSSGITCDASKWLHVKVLVEGTKATLVFGYDDNTVSYTWENFGTLSQYYVSLVKGNRAFVVNNFQITEAVKVPETVKDLSYAEELFAGYYVDANRNVSYDAAAEGATGYAYPKFVDANVLSVKAQKSDGTGGAKNVRFVTSVDSLNYGKVGFEITVGNKTITKETTKVYAQLQAGTQQVDPSVFSSQSQYMAAYSLWEIPESAFDTEIKVRAYWETPEGLIVYGAYRTVTVNGLA